MGLLQQDSKVSKKKTTKKGRQSVAGSGWSSNHKENVVCVCVCVRACVCVACRIIGLSLKRN